MTQSAAWKGQLPRHKLMIPGPVEVEDSVLEEMGSQVVADLGSEWVALYRNTIDQLKAVFRTAGELFLLVSSGSGGVEAAIGSLFAPMQKVIVVTNGFFGERVASIARLCGLEVLSVTAPWGKPIDLGDVRHAIINNLGVAGLIAVHHETSTGILNPVRDLGMLAGEFGIPVVVDAVSSLGGEVFAMDDWGIDICVTSSSKCLEAPPGLAPIAVSSRAWEIMNHQSAAQRGWYLNLRVWRQHALEWADWHPFPVTMATSNVRALNTALSLLLNETIERRIARYRDAAVFFRIAAGNLGFHQFVDEEFAANTITALKKLPNMEVAHLSAFLRDKHGIRIAGGLGETSGMIFRVGHMGKAGSRTYVEQLIQGLVDYLAVKVNG